MSHRKYVFLRYSDRSKTKGELWEAVCAPASNIAAATPSGRLPPWSAGEDERANSMLSGLGGGGGEGVSGSALW